MSAIVQSDSDLLNRRQVVVATSVVNECRDMMGQALARSIEPCFDLVDRAWLTQFAGCYSPRASHLLNTDHIYYRAAAAAGEIAPYDRDNLPALHRGMESAISRARKMVFEQLSIDLLLVLRDFHLTGASSHGQPLAKAWVSWYADQLRTPLHADAPMVVNVLAHARRETAG